MPKSPTAEKPVTTPVEDPEDAMLSSPVTIGSVTTRTFGTNKKSIVYDHVVGLLPNGKPLNVMTHGDHIKVIVPN